MLKGTKVDGVYDQDPAVNSEAQKYESITFKEVLNQELRVMDMTAITLCKENNLPIRVFDITRQGDLQKLVNGKKVGTLVSE